MDSGEELAEAKRAVAARSAAAQRNRTNAHREDQDAFRFLDRLRRLLLDNAAPGRQENRERWATVQSERSQSSQQPN